MRIIPILFVLLLAGCNHNLVKPECADIPVYQKPTFDMPAKPTMRSSGQKSDGETVRDVELDMFDLKEYALKLENLLQKFK